MSVVVAPHLLPRFGGLGLTGVAGSDLTPSMPHVTGTNSPPASKEWVSGKLDDELTEITNMFERGHTTPVTHKFQSAVDSRIYVTSKNTKQPSPFLSPELVSPPLSSQTSLSNVVPASLGGGPLNSRTVTHDLISLDGGNHHLPFSVGTNFTITDGRTAKRPRGRPPKSGPPPAKRPRGRPPKLGPPPAKRPVGRPRKHPIRAPIAAIKRGPNGVSVDAHLLLDEGSSISSTSKSTFSGNNEPSGSDVSSQNLQVEAPLSKEFDPPPAKRPVGRPRKHPATVFSIAVKQPVGRPKKFPISTDFPLDESSAASSDSRPFLSRSNLFDAEDRELSDGSDPTSMSLVGALSSAFANNAAQIPFYELQSEQPNLISAMNAAFSGNVVPENSYSDDESSAQSSDSEPSPQIMDLPSKPPHKRRQAFRPVPQIPSPKKPRLCAGRGPYVIPTEQTLEGYLGVEKFIVQLPLGVSIAPENASEYLDFDDEVLLDYDPCVEVDQELQKQQKLKARQSIWKNNVRFIARQFGASTRIQSVPFRQYHTISLPSSTTYLQRVHINCGEDALYAIMGEQPGWEANLKPRKYRREALIVDKVYSEAKSSETEEKDIHTTVPQKRSHSCDTAPRKKSRSSESVSIDDSDATDQKIHLQINAVLCEKLLQKLIKGKVRITGQELEYITSFLKEPSLEQVMRAYINREVDDSHQACDSIWDVLKQIAQSPLGTLGIPEDMECEMMLQAKKIVKALNPYT
ncbi:hypothetical protein BDP27DRAFT_157246 [Rhodocollybia butyracea]|uniref:Uncharacterized protein n=1 Tax=Rhodocollybia butyracea TaxID=206335 RepID=A0A9P5PFZ1_9AGAR|nr:hypothetical protein BDP27DRAFT_157246 [Rhodocollybia butyracea]